MGTFLSVACVLPIDDPNKPLSRDEYIAFLRAKGLEITKTADHTFTSGRVVHHWVGPDGAPERKAESPKPR